MVRVAIESFLETARQPVLIEPGEDPLDILPDKFVLGSRGGLCTLECWNEKRNLVRRIRAISKTRRGFLELEVEHFGGRTGALLLIDQAQASNTATSRRGGRLKYRELFRMSLRRQFSDWKLVELSTEPDLHHSLSPAYPRALLRRGTQGIAAIGAAEDALDPDGALTFGLIWLDYLRRRETRLSVGTLVIFVPIGAENTTCHRVRYLNPEAVQVRVFVHGSGILEEPVEPGDYTNFSTRLDSFCSPSANADLTGWITRVAAIEGVDRRDRPDGSTSLTVRGLEFARVSGSSLHFGIDQSIPSILPMSGSLPKLKRWPVALPVCAIRLPGIMLVLYINDIPKPGSNRRCEAPCRDWTPRFATRPYMVRLPSSPPAIGAFWIFSPPTTTAGWWSSKLKPVKTFIYRCKPWIIGCASNGIWSAASSKAADTFPEFRCVRSRPGCCWSLRLLIFILQMRRYCGTFLLK